MMQYDISKTYSSANFNLLGNTSVIAQVPDIKSPVIQVIHLSENLADGDVYVQRKGNPPLYAITKNGLKKLADGAGIKTISSKHVLPTTCQKCAAANVAARTAPRCWECPNRDTAYSVTIAVPQLTGEVVTVEDTHEIIVEQATVGMTPNQKTEFLRHLPQICEAKALNGAIRTALHIKGTYTLDQIRKPFVVAYLVPNLNHSEVKQAAIHAMFGASEAMFGSAAALDKTPDVAQIESRVPDQPHLAIEAADGEQYDQYVDGTYQTVQETPQIPQNVEPQAVVPQPVNPPAAQPAPQTQGDHSCVECGQKLSEKVFAYSNKVFGQPLCYGCQQKRRER